MYHETNCFHYIFYDNEELNLALGVDFFKNLQSL